MTTLRQVCLHLAFLLSFVAMAQPVESRSMPDSYLIVRDRGWAEIVIRTADPQPMLTFAVQVAGWRSDGPHCDGEGCQWWITDASSGVGSVRVIEDSSLVKQAAEPAPEPLSFGGIFSLMARSNALQQMYDQARQRGWQSLSLPVEIRFGDVTLKNVILYHPAVGAISIYERLTPRMADAEDLRKLRRPFNSMQIVQSMEKAKKFYVEDLGFAVIAEGRYYGDPSGPNNFGLPPGSEFSRALDYLIVAPSADSETHIEIVRFVTPASSQIADHPAGLDGWEGAFEALRFPVRSLRRLQQSLEGTGVRVSPVFMQAFPPFEAKASVRVSSPEGAVIEFFEIPDL